jgi:16S rRNA (adenine1518-N6/adenine1519-N6)-dimethyltransferase
MPVPKKSLGQNFLQHPQIAERMVRAANLEPGTPVLEIGPGTGMLTRVLLEAGHPVVAVETDAALAEELAATGPTAYAIANGDLTLIHGDIRAFDAETLPATYALVANIPYYITGEIIRMFLTAKHKPGTMVLLVQKEVAERIARSGNTGGNGQKRTKESLLSLSVKAYGTPEYCFTVPKGAFFPVPNVDSAVLAVRNIRPNTFENIEKEGLFFEILRAGFAHKRKLLIRNLEVLFSPQKLGVAFTEAGLSPNIRPEDLTLENWRTLMRLLS